MELKKQNYCSLIPDKIFSIYIGDYCKQHDKEYRYMDNSQDREDADINFFKSLIKKCIWLFPLWFLIYVALRLFGGIYFSWKWKVKLL